MFLKDEIEYFHTERVRAFDGVFVDTFRPGKVGDFSKISTHSLIAFILSAIIPKWPKRRLLSHYRILKYHY